MPPHSDGVAPSGFASPVCTMHATIAVTSRLHWSLLNLISAREPSYGKYTSSPVRTREESFASVYWLGESAPG